MVAAFRSLLAGLLSEVALSLGCPRLSLSLFWVIKEAPRGLGMAGVVVVVPEDIGSLSLHGREVS